MTFTSYAQNFEDVMLWRALGHIEHGRYIDIGAQDPVIDSVSKCFHLAGWQGVHVEPTPAYAAALRANRPNDMVIEAAIGESDGPITFYEFQQTGLSTGSADIAESHVEHGFAHREISVSVLPLEQLLEQIGPGDIHWMKIDVEGMEPTALRSWCDHPARPWIVLLESTFPNSYDTICHEHLEYYSLGVVNKILDAAGMKVVDVIMNNVNGGSFAVTATKRASQAIQPNNAVINGLLEQEERMGINTPAPYREFEERVFRHREDLIRLIRALRADGKTVLGYGASTKGNVVLQFCGFTTDDIPAIADVNSEKFGRVTPGIHIPIISEEEARKMSPDYYLVLPWHFKEGILRREKEYLNSGGKFIFPFPEIEII